MRKPSPGRVVVGVHDSPAGLGALRAAVAQARSSGRELLAVRAFSPPQPDQESIWQTRPAFPMAVVPDLTPSPSWYRLLAARKRQAARAVEDAFAQAMGGIPRDVRVRPVTVLGSPGPVLVAAAHQEDDLLVVGVAAPPLPRRGLRLFPSFPWLRQSVGRYCSAHASCAVLAVPPNDLARRIEATHRPRHWPILPKGAGPMRRTHTEQISSATGDAETAPWPARACCCPAAPMVKVLIPTARHAGRPVDLFLCGHHYRASLGPLALAEATVVFREHSSVVSLAGIG